MAGIEGIGSIGGGENLDEFKRVQEARVTEARTQAAQPQPQPQQAADAGAAKGIGNAQGGPSVQQYPQL